MNHPRFSSRLSALFVLGFTPVVWLGATASLHAQDPKRRPSPTPAAASAKSSPTPVPAGGTYELPDPVAVVNGEKITREDLTKVANALLVANGRNLEELGASDKKRMYQSVLDEIISDRLIAKASVGTPVDDMEVEKRLGQFRAQYPDQKSFEDATKQAGQTLDQIKANVRTQLRQLAWMDKVTADDTKVDPAEAEKFYKENPPSRFDAPETIRASHILVAVRKDAPPEASVKAEDKVKVLTDKLAKGETFESLAKTFSDDPTAKQTEGDLGYFSRDRIMPEFADAAFKLKVGEISPPVRTQFGIHLIKLTDRRPAHTATLEEARDQITTYLRAEKRKAAVIKLVDSLKGKAKIENRIE